MDVLEYLDRQGRSPFAAWFDHLDPAAATKVTTAMTRLSLGNTSNVQSVGAGIFESKINFGPGYRVYFGKDGERFVILLAGGTKQRQQQGIVAARERWRDYTDRKKGQMKDKV
jgi:putative addiction module killer protein